MSLQDQLNGSNAFVAANLSKIYDRLNVLERYSDGLQSQVEGIATTAIFYGDLLYDNLDLNLGDSAETFEFRQMNDFTAVDLVSIGFGDRDCCCDGRRGDRF